MEEVFLRFPHLGQKMFDHLDQGSLKICTEVNESWRKYIVDERIHFKTLIRSYTNCSNKNLKQVLKTIFLETLANDVFRIFNVISDYISCRVDSTAETNPYGLTLDDFKAELKENYIGNYDTLFTPLHSAATIGHLPICKLIIEFALDKNPRCRANVTPLHIAAANGHFEIYKLIMDKVEDKNPKILTPMQMGWDPQIEYSDSTPIDLARNNGHDAIVTLIESNIH